MTNTLALLGYKAPNGILEEFFRGLEKASPNASLDKLRASKNFTGNKYLCQSKAVAGSAINEFSLLANGSAQTPQDEHSKIDFIRVYSGISATVDKTVWVGGVVDPDLLNSTFDIVNNGKVVMKKVPMTLFQQSTGQNDSGVLPLTSPFYWLAQTDLKIVVNSPVAVAAANTNLKFELSGAGLIS